MFSRLTVDIASVSCWETNVGERDSVTKNIYVILQPESDIIFKCLSVPVANSRDEDHSCHLFAEIFLNFYVHLKKKHLEFHYNNIFVDIFLLD